MDTRCNPTPPNIIAENHSNPPIPILSINHPVQTNKTDTQKS